MLEDEEAANALTQIKTEILLKENHNGDKDLSAAIDYFAENMSETTFPNMLKKITESRREMVKFIEQYKGLSGFLHKLAEKLGISDHESEETIKRKFMDSVRSRTGEVLANIRAWSCGTESTDKPKARVCADVIERNFQIED